VAKSAKKRLREAVEKAKRVAIERAKRLVKKEPSSPEEDPYAYVTVPKKPRPPCRSAAAVAEPPKD